MREEASLMTPGKIIWFTGVSGSGKSTLATALAFRFAILGWDKTPILLDGDALRSGLNKDLGFSSTDRTENIRRAAEVAKILSNAGHTVVAAFITPLESLRSTVRGLFEPGRYVEIFLDCPLGVCEARDVKGLYSRARNGEVSDFTGISAPFEVPTRPDLVIPTGQQTVRESLDMIINWLERKR